MAKEQFNFMHVSDLGSGRLVEGTWGDDIGEFSGNNDQIFGFGGNDFLMGGAGSDLIDGGDGNDTIGGDSGNDILYGGTGDDGISGGSGNDTINGGSGNDTIDGGDGDDTITDLSGVDRIMGGSGNDIITVHGGDWFRFDNVAGGGGSDTIFLTGSKVIAEGNSGNDTFYADLSRDTVMIGGDGSDRFVVTGAHPIGSGQIAEIQGGNATLYVPNAFGVEFIDHVTAGGDTSVDTLDLSQLPQDFGSVSVNLATGKMFDLEGVQLAKITGIENVVGSNASDTLTGNGVANDLRGGAGDDVINGGGGDDLLIGGAGRDTIIGGSGRDRILGDHFTDTPAADTLTGGADADTFVFVRAAQSQALSTTISSAKNSVMDKITDFDATGTDHDFIDVSTILDLQSNFTGTTAQQAISQGYLYFLRNGSSTIVMFDANGGTHGDAANNYAIAELADIAPADLRADHFYV